MEHAYENIPGYAHQTCKLIDVLQKGTPGHVITDDELSNIARCDVSPTGDKKSFLYSAIRYCERNGVVWARVRGEKCIECASSSGILKSSDGDIRRIKRASTRAARKLACVDTQKLTPQEGKLFASRVAHIATLAAVASQDSANVYELQAAHQARLLEQKSINKAVADAQKAIGKKKS